jgi:hypothetical protein
MPNVVRPEILEVARDLSSMHDIADTSLIADVHRTFVGKAAELSAPVVVRLVAMMTASGNVDGRSAATIAGLRVFAPPTGRPNRLALAVEIPASAGRPAVDMLTIAWSDRGRGKPFVFPQDEEDFLSGLTQIETQEYEGDVGDAMSDMVRGKFSKDVVASATASMHVEDYWIPFTFTRCGDTWDIHFEALASIADAMGLGEMRKAVASRFYGRKYLTPESQDTRADRAGSLARSLLALDDGFPSAAVRAWTTEFRTALMGISMTEISPRIAEILEWAEAGGFEGETEFGHNDMDCFVRIVGRHGTDGRSVYFRDQDFAHVLRLEDGGAGAILTTHELWDGRPGDPEERPEDDDYPDLLSRAAAGGVAEDETLMAFVKEDGEWVPTRMFDEIAGIKGAWTSFVYGIEAGHCALEQKFASPAP